MSEKRDCSSVFSTILAVKGFEYNMYNFTEPDSNAKQVFSEMQELIYKMKPIRLNTDRSYYRARRISTEEVSEKNGFSLDENGAFCHGFNEKQSGMAPRICTKTGRLNHKWEPIWYLAEDEYTAMAEVKPEIREQISVAKYCINKDIKLLDFSNEKIDMQAAFGGEKKDSSKMDAQTLYVAMQKIFSLPSYKKRTYYISNIISDFIKETEVAGIKYKSFYGPGENIALWNINEKNIHFQGSKVYLYYCTKQAFLSLEDKKVLDDRNYYEEQMDTNINEIIRSTESMLKMLIKKNGSKDR